MIAVNINILVYAHRRAAKHCWCSNTPDTSATPVCSTLYERRPVTNGFLVLSAGKREKSRSADHSSVTR